MRDRAHLVSAIGCFGVAAVSASSLGAAAAGAVGAAHWLRVIGSPVALAILAGGLLALAHGGLAPSRLSVLLFAGLLAFGVSLIAGPRMQPSIQAAQLVVLAVAWAAICAWVVGLRERVGRPLAWVTTAFLGLGVLAHAMALLVLLRPRFLWPLGADVPAAERATALAERISLLMNLSGALQIAYVMGVVLLGVCLLRLRGRLAAG